MRLRDDKKRALILKQAASLFSIQPFHKVRLDDVAAAAQVGKGTLYIYFKSKEDLFFEILYTGFANLIDTLHQQTRPDTPPPDRLAIIVRGLVDFAFAHPEFWELMRSVGSTGPMLHAQWAVKRAELFNLIQSTIKDGVTAGQFHDLHPDLTATYLPGLVRAAMLYGPKTLTPQSLASHILNLITHGLTHTP